MSILIDEKTPILVQGITGDKGSFHAKEMIDYGSNVVAGVTPGKGGKIHHGVPVFNTVKEAVKRDGRDHEHHLRRAGLLRRRHHGGGRRRHPPDLLDHRRHSGAGHDAREALLSALSEGSPPDDGRPELRRHHFSPGKAMLGIMPGHIYKQGSVGVISRSGTLGYEAASQLKALGIGVSTSVGIGGDPINGSSFLDHLVLFDKDPETEAVLMIGEIGGPQEAEAAAWIKENFSKPVVGFVAGLTAPKGRRMGHAGAIISSTGDSAAEKTEIMKSYGLTVAPSPAEFGETVAKVLKRA